MYKKFVFLMSLVLMTGLCPAGRAATLNRPMDPVVLTGSDVSSLVGADTDKIVGFRYQSGWQQIPVQVDERKLADLNKPYNDPAVGVEILMYVDSGTYTGADTNPQFDSDDELVFMAGDAGSTASGSEPAGVISGTGLELVITDPLDSGTGYVYLFRTDGTLNPAAGQNYVDYTYNLLCGDYLSCFSLGTGYDPEDSNVISPYYQLHFSDRWIRDEIKIYAGGATGVDILDRHKFMFRPGFCIRSEDTFSQGEGCFIANKDGAVRGIRSYMGANSGHFTQRDHLFYKQREDVINYSRVHEIEGSMDLIDHSPAASGMSYYNNNNMGGVVIDGQADSVTAGELTWEMVTGAQGTLVHARDAITDIPDFNSTSYYNDSTRPGRQCTGDKYEYGQSGMWVNHGIPNTNPTAPPYNNLTGFRIISYQTPNQNVDNAQLRYQQSITELSVAVSPYGGTPDTTPPTPNPMTWATAPYATGSTTIAMVATTATDASGVEYFFDCTSTGGHDSAWQDGTSYTDTGLSPGTQYCYRVQARDKSSNHNATGWSTTQCATTQTGGDTTPPTPNPMTWAVLPYATGTTSIAMTATTATDASGVEYFFDCTSGAGGHDSAWQSGTTYTDTGLSPGTQYCYRVQARDLSPNQNATGWSSTQCATTQSGGGPVIFSDGFESGNFTAGGWTTSGSTATVTTAAAYTGTYGAKLGKLSWIEKAISTSGYTSIHVKYARKTFGLDAGEEFKAQWYDGSNWNTLESTLDTSWAEKDWLCGSGANNNPNFRIRFSSSGGAPNQEYSYLDIVEVNGTQ